MKVLVLGSEGQIGKPLVTQLEEQGHEVRGWDKASGDDQDLSNSENYLQLERDCFWADKVYFLAFEVGGSKFLESADKNFDYIQENSLLMAYVFKALRTTKTPFLFASSQMANMHHTNYGFLKDLGERYTKSLSNGWICRFWNVFGVEHCEEEKRHVITDFIEAAKSGEIHMRTSGEEERQFLHVDDCNRALLQWLDNVWDDRDQYYDITSFSWHSIRDIALIISSIIPGDCKITGTSLQDTVQLGRKNPPSDYIKRFWKPELTLEQGIKKVYETIK